ncbi:phosphodiester glycosidase family protein [Algirhabdus cladophorae]|uniref:phosphodiester glycosidase family protein n=1 Tax=Algirhabdus cladophorae TaxID=3377108 RepID=UPI003B849BC5
MMRGLFLALALMISGPAGAVECSEQSYDGQSFSVCRVDLTTERLQLFLRDGEGQTIGSFRRLQSLMPDKSLEFAMNAGMYHDDRAPVGHYVENGTEVMRVVQNAGPGNFGMLPNGILCVQPDAAYVIETLAFVAQQPQCQHATQSGPMLLIDGAVHPRFLPDSTFRNVRNGVGTSDDGKSAVFVVSDTQVTFYELALFFRDAIGVKNALYFDGRVSKLHAPKLGRSDLGVRMGPIIGVVN